MVKNILIFIPNSLKLKKCGYLEGLHLEYEDCEAYYITNNVVVKNSNQAIGYSSDVIEKGKIKETKAIHLNNSTWQINLLNYIGSNNSIVRIDYDYPAFQHVNELTLTENCYGLHFHCLINNLKRKKPENNTNGKRRKASWIFALLMMAITSTLQFLKKFHVVTSYSATVSLFSDSLENFKWLIDEISTQKRITPKIGNFLSTKLFDIAIGLVLFKVFIVNEQTIVELFENTREIMIVTLRDLLTYLMGSPIGLKLNYAFNRSLGYFFFYHIALWRVFLEYLQPFVRKYFIYFALPGSYFGLSYQIALLSDLISIATFHVYCIYIYAARLFFLQLKSLLSLWRLFIGRKYNPLRQRVDSYQYSQNQLFIGTLGFTVLLFLLPTTAMYYVVFVTFRLVIMIIEEVLLVLRYLLNCLPIYVLMLWIVKSPDLDGPLCLRWKKSINGVVNLEAKLKTIPLLVAIKKFTPGGIKSRTNQWKDIMIHKKITVD